MRVDHLTRAFGVLAAAWLAGCAADTAGLAPQPEDTTPAVLGIYVGDVLDADRDGYRDTVVVTAYLFAPDYQALWIDGSFHFRFTDDSGSELATWEISAEDARQVRCVTNVGRAYWFSLSTTGQDDPPRVRSVKLVGTFTEAATGRSLRSTHPVEIILSERAGREQHVPSGG